MMEERLAAVEAALRELKQKLAPVLNNPERDAEEARSMEDTKPAQAESDEEARAVDSRE